MLTLEKMIGQLEEAININSDDTVFSDRLFIDLINQARAVFIRQDLNKKRTADPTIIQELPCVEMEPTTAALCGCLDIPGNCQLLRSKKKIPDTIELSHNDGILSVRPVQIIQAPFSYVDYKRIPHIHYSRFTKNVIYAFLLDDYMYLYSPGQEHYGLIEQIHIRGIFEDPTEAGNFVNSCGDPCFTQESNYPVATWMFESAIKPHILQQMVVKTQAPLDKDNNANDDTVPQPTPRLPMRQRTEAAPQQQKARRR
tara:strand:- start:18229 stop:18993 length:765 start_codon:yes stop_codon:yes gene_type:complete